MARLHRASRDRSSDLELSRRELCALPARLVTGLPIETRIFVQAAGTKTEFVLTTAAEAPAARARGERRGPCWLAADELNAVVLGVEMDRMFASDLIGFALRKLHDGAFRVTDEHTLGGAQPPSSRDGEAERPDRRELTFGEVLEVLDLRITGIEVGPVRHPSRDAGDDVTPRAA